MIPSGEGSLKIGEVSPGQRPRTAGGGKEAPLQVISPRAPDCVVNLLSEIRSSLSPVCLRKRGRERQAVVVAVAAATCHVGPKAVKWHCDSI